MKKESKYLFIIAGFFLGFSPLNEPHLFGKINWVIGGAVEMKLMDWLDLVMHGLAILITVGVTISLIFPSKKNQKSK